MSLYPKWLSLLNGCEKVLNKSQIKELEVLRRKYNVPNEYFSIGVGASSELCKIIIRRDYRDLLKAGNPSLSEKEALTFLLHHENRYMEMAGSPEVMSEEDITNAAKEINTLDDLCDFITALEQKEQGVYCENEVACQIESIIKNK